MFNVLPFFLIVWYISLAPLSSVMAPLLAPLMAPLVAPPIGQLVALLTAPLLAPLGSIMALFFSSIKLCYGSFLQLC